MSISCDVVLDLIPLVKDAAASEDSIGLVTEHIKSCEGCKAEFESYSLAVGKEIDDKKIISSIKKKLLFITSALLLAGAAFGMALNKETPSALIPIIIALSSIAFVGVLVFKFDFKGDSNMNRFFMGKAIGTIIVFGALGVYLLLRYVLHLF